MGGRDVIEIEPYCAEDLPIIEAFIAGLHDAERELDARLTPGAELAAGGIERMLSEFPSTMAWC
jgi:hypothetical protein